MKHSTLTALFLLLPVSAQAATFQANDTVRVDEALNDDIYAAGASITIDAPVAGDVIAVGSDLYLRGEVEEDLTAAGGNVVMTGAVGDDIRVAGGDIRLEGTVGDDLFAAGGRINIADTVVVQGEARLSGGDIVSDATYQTGAVIRGGRVLLRGRFLGNLDVKAEEIIIDGTVSGLSTLVGETIEIREGAQFLGDIRYWNEAGVVDFGETSVTVSRDESLAPRVYEQTPRDTIAELTAGLAAATLFAAVAIILFAFGAKKLWIDAGKELEKSFGQSFMYGLLYVVGMPVLCILLFVTILGIPFSLLTGVLFVFTLYFARAITAMVLARWIDRRFDKPWKTGPFILASIVIYAGLRILSQVPFIGWLLCAILVLAGLGAFLRAKWKLLRAILKKL